MKTKDRLRQFLGIVLALMVSFLWTTEVAYAQGGEGIRGGCFASDTPILTPTGYQPINQLRQGSQIVGYSLPRHQPEIVTVGKLKAVAATEYYVINDAIKVTGTHPFYVLTPDEIKQVEVRQLKIGDRLLGKDSNLRISSLRHVEAPITVYNLTAVTPNHNFYAGGFLVHAGSFLVIHEKHNYYYPQNITPPSSYPPAPISKVLLILVVLIPGAFLREIYNLIRFRGKEFTEDEEL